MTRREKEAHFATGWRRQHSSRRLYSRKDLCLREIDHILRTESPKRVPSKLLEWAVSVSGLSRGMLAIRVSPHNHISGYQILTRFGYLDEEATGRGAQMTQASLLHALNNKQPLFEEIEDTGAATLPHRQMVVALPLFIGKRCMGALVLDCPRRRDPFRAGETSLLQDMAGQIAIACALAAKMARAKQTPAASLADLPTAEDSQREDYQSEDSQKAVRRLLRAAIWNTPLD